MQRRTFVKSAASVIAAGTSAFAAGERVVGANDRIRIAVLGVNGRGKDHIKGFEPQNNVEVAVLCDPDLNIAEQRAAEFQQTYGRKPKVVQDLRDVFADKDIDCVSVATPNHWHTLAAIWACQAGKDVFIEKPGTHTFSEGRKLIEAARKYNRIVQHGVQLRSNPAIQEAVQKLREGVIGDVYMGRALIYKWRASVGRQPDEPVPEGLDWNLWQGPAQERNFSRRYVHYNWHWHWDYGNGDIGNQGVHETDLLLWGLDTGLPNEVMSLGGKFLWDDDRETPELMTALLRFPNKKIIGEIAVRPWCTNPDHDIEVGNIFYGSEGYMTISWYDTYKVFLGRKRTPGPSREVKGRQFHYENFIKAVRSRKTSDQNGPVETAHTSPGLAHLANIALRTGRQLHFDVANEKFVGDREANRLLTRNYRTAFAVPDKV